MPPIRSVIGRSGPRAGGVCCRFRSSRPCTATVSGVERSSPSARICASPRRTRGSPSPRSPGAWSPIGGGLLPATQAQHWGLVTPATPDPLQESLRLAREIAGKSPDAIRAAKRLLHDTWNRNDPSAVLLREATLQQRLIRQPNQIAAVAAGMAGEPALFTDPTVDLT